MRGTALYLPKYLPYKGTLKNPFLQAICKNNLDLHFRPSCHTALRNVQRVLPTNYLIISITHPVWIHYKGTYKIEYCKQFVKKYLLKYVKII